MILHKVTFGSFPNEKKAEAIDLADEYLVALLHNGQISGEFSFGTSRGVLAAYIHLSGIAGHSLKNHSKYGREYYYKIAEFFGKPPTWQNLDDDVPKRDTTWKNAPFLYLFTDMFESESPLRRGDNGQPIPLYLLPGKHEDREGIYFWQNSYRNHDSIWIGSGELEIPAYKQLAEPASELSQIGLDICQAVEKATNIPTYYFLIRYWGRRISEAKRRCPGCGRAWRTENLFKNPHRFWHFDFQCKHCRLVSHTSDADDDERHAFIGEYKKMSKRTNE